MLLMTLTAYSFMFEGGALCFTAGHIEQLTASVTFVLCITECTFCRPARLDSCYSQ